MALFRALTHRSFALLWVGQTISRVGDHLYQVALAWWVLEKTGSALAMGTVLTFSMVPMLLFVLIGGVAVDRLPRVRLLLISDLGRGIAAAGVAWLALSGRLEIWHIYGASLLFGLADAFFQPAYLALVPELTPVSALTSANSLTSLSMQAGRIVGPALGAALVGLGGTTLAFAGNALSFFAAALLVLPLLRLSTAPAPSASQGVHGIVRDLREGLAVVAGSPILWVTILLFSLTNITLAGPFAVALPFLVKDHLHGDVRTLGLLYAVFPIGYVLGGLWMGRYPRLRWRGLVSYGGAIVAGLGLAVLGANVPLVVILLAALINGAALEVFGLIWTNILQTVVPGDKLGRVASFDMLGSFMLLPIGYGLTGWATEALGPALVFIAGGLLTALITALGLLHPAVRRFD
ncbi:MAG: MFS transporter [Anaerolineae bacterium]